MASPFDSVKTQAFRKEETHEGADTVTVHAVWLERIL
jgi:hypothetical protein